MAYPIGEAAYHRHWTTWHQTLTYSSLTKNKSNHFYFYPLYGHKSPRTRLPPRQSFVEKIPINKKQNSQECYLIRPKVNWPTWRTLNRLHTGVSKANANLVKWGYQTDEQCECSNIQTMEHLLKCPDLPVQCLIGDVTMVTEKAIRLVRKLAERIWSRCGTTLMMVTRFYSN